VDPDFGARPIPYLLTRGSLRCGAAGISLALRWQWHRFDLQGSNVLKSVQFGKRGDPEPTPAWSIPCACSLPVLTRFGRPGRIGPSRSPMIAA